jgi:hypothetical protein
MLEFFGTGFVGALLGGLFRLAPEVLKYFDKKDERSHELKMFTLQTDLEKMKGQFRMEEKYVDFSKTSLDAIGEAFKQQAEADSKAWKWVASVSALVRPGIAWVLFGLYTAVKIVVLHHAILSGLSPIDVVKTVWTAEDFGILLMVLTFYYVGRPIEKYTGR